METDEYVSGGRSARHTYGAYLELFKCDDRGKRKINKSAEGFTFQRRRSESQTNCRNTGATLDGELSLNFKAYDVTETFVICLIFLIQLENEAALLAAPKQFLLNNNS